MRAHIFDFDGTLVRSLGVWRQADDEFFARRGMACPEDLYKKIAHMNLVQASELIKRDFGLSESVSDIVHEFTETVRHKYAREVRLVDGAGEYLKKLKATGEKIALATSSTEELYLPCLKNNGVDTLFDAFATTAEAGCTKGSERVYLLAAEKLNVPPERCMVYEDILPAIDAARRAGMRTLAILEPRSKGDWERIKGTADRWAFDFSDM